MTLIESAPASGTEEDGAGGDVRASERRRTRWTLIVLGVIVVFGTGAVLGWWAVSAMALGGVSVVYDAQPLRCAGTETGLHAGGDDGTFLAPVAVLAPGMVCELRAHVVNEGWAEVVVSEVGVLGLADANPLGLRAVSVSPNGEPQAPAPQIEDGASFAVAGELAVPPGGSQEFIVRLEYAGAAKADPCTAFGWSPIVVTARALGAESSIEPGPGSDIWFQQGSLDECR